MKEPTGYVNRQGQQVYLSSPSSGWYDIDGRTPKRKRELPILFIPSHGLADRFLEIDAWAEAEFGHRFFDAEFEVVAHELQAREVKERRFLGAAPAGQRLGKPRHRLREPQRRTPRR